MIRSSIFGHGEPDPKNVTGMTVNGVYVAGGHLAAAYAVARVRDKGDVTVVLSEAAMTRDLSKVVEGAQGQIFMTHPLAAKTVGEPPFAG